MMSPSNSADTQGGQQNAPALQQPRNDLQSSADSTQSGQSSSMQSTPPMNQDQLSAPQLRVGDSGTVIQNSTSITPQVMSQHGYPAATWLWLFVPIILVVFLLWPQKTRQRNNSAEPVSDEALEIIEKEAAPAAAVSPPKKPRRKKRSKKK